jgi:hypothetical protein
MDISGDNDVGQGSEAVLRRAMAPIVEKGCRWGELV